MTNTMPKQSPVPMRAGGVASFVLVPVLGFALAVASSGCAVSRHQTIRAALGTPASSDEMLALIRRPGPIEFEKVLAAHWQVLRSGLINLDNPIAKQAKLEDGNEPIELYFYVLRHPKFGMYLVDSGVEDAFLDPDSSPQLSWVVKAAMKLETLDVRQTTGKWLASQPLPLAGVFLTHLHLDHIMGLPDLPKGTPVFVGPGETLASQWLNAFTQGTTDRFLEGLGALREWPFERDPAHRFQGLVDVFGDGSLWALHVPGHTSGSTAFLVRTPQGSRLLLGDASHTRWGWRHGVEPGTFSQDPPQSAVSFKALRDLAKQFPNLEIHPGHQSL